MDQAQIDEFWQKYKVPLGLGFVGLVLLLFGSYSSGVFKSFSTKPTISSKQTVVKMTASTVDVSGAVNNPGVYTLAYDSRVEDALKAAGGISASASSEYVRKNLNLASKLSDGMKIYIPFVSEAQPAVVDGTSTQEVAGIVSINNSTMETLDSLPGVGPVTAQKIIKYRPYNDPYELVSRKIVSSAVYQKIKDLISL